MNIRSTISKHKQLIIVALAVMLLSFVVLYSTAQRSRSSSKSRVASCSVEVCIPLSKESSESREFTVKSGTFVQFNSVDGQKHNIALVHSGVQHDDESRYESGDFGSGEAWKVQFKKDGAYTFEDKYNEGTEISVVVYTPGKDYKIK